MSDQHPVDPEYGIPERLFIPELIYNDHMFGIPDDIEGQLVDYLQIQRRLVPDGWDYCITGSWQHSGTDLDKGDLPPYFQTFVPHELDRQYPPPADLPPIHYLGVVNQYLTDIAYPGFRTSKAFGTGALRVPGGWLLFGFHYQYHKASSLPGNQWRLDLDFSNRYTGAVPQTPVTYGTHLVHGYKLNVAEPRLRSPEELGG